MTVEGLSSDEDLTPLQNSFRKHHGLQCGFCTPGILMTAHALLTKEPEADEERIRDVLSGNLCRCTGYISIVKSVMGSAIRLSGQGGAIVNARAALVGKPIERVEDFKLLRGEGQLCR